MEGGNYGYRDEMTGAGWSARRTNMEAEIPRRHWHSDDPGSVPNVRINGAGSPSGITVYEGTLLPKQFQGALIHADPGPNEVRAFTVATDGAGYTAERIPLITTQTDRMFRPVDVAVAPDGSLFVADWYDAGVGGHNMSDQSQGRIIRIAPPGMRYTVPKLDLSSPAGAAQALRSPNLATRQLAYERLAGYGRRAERALASMWRSSVPHDRARALWLLTRIPGRGTHYLADASRDADPNIRITALRATRRIDGDVIAMADRLMRDPSPAVRREVAIALRHDESRRAAVGEKREQPEGSRAVVRHAAPAYGSERTLGAAAVARELLVGELARREVRAAQRTRRAGGRREVELRYRVARARRRDADDPALRLVGHVVAADAGVVPVGDEERSVGRDGDVDRPEHLVGLRRDERDPLGCVPRAVGGDGEGAHLVRSWVGVDERALKLLRQQRSLVDRDPRR
jgi:hypothetical protein